MFPKLLYPRIKYGVKQGEDFIIWLSYAQRRSPVVRFTIMSTWKILFFMLILIDTHVNDQVQLLQWLFLKAVVVMWNGVTAHTHRILWRTRNWSSSNLCAPDNIQLTITWPNTVVICLTEHCSYLLCPSWYLKTPLPYMKKIKIRKKPLFNFLIEANHDDLQLCAPVPAFPAFSCRWERMCLNRNSELFNWTWFESTNYNNRPTAVRNDQEKQSHFLPQ